MALRLVRSDEPPRLDDVYRRYCRYVAAVILRLGVRADELEDLVQDVFVEAARGLKHLREPEALKGWLATIAVRLVRRRLRLARLRRFLGFPPREDRGTPVDPGASPLDKLLLRTVLGILYGLPIEERLAFCLHHMEGEGLETVARLCGCSLATTKRRIARARKAIEERMRDE